MLDQNIRVGGSDLLLCEKFSAWVESNNSAFTTPNLGVGILLNITV